MINKKPRLKPLEQSDVFAILVRQEKKKDRTQQYKQMLRRSNPISQLTQQKVKIQLNLPQFATLELTQAQIFDYHIKNEKLNNYEQYTQMLDKVNNKIKQVLITYHDKLCEGQDHIDQLIQHSGISFRIIDDKRKHIQNLQSEIKRGYKKIGPTLRKINNIKKVLEIMKIWGKTKLPFLMSVNVTQPYRYDLKDLLFLIDEAIQIIHDNSDTSKALKSVALTLSTKKQALIKNVYDQFFHSIINFSSIPQYKVKFEQYLLIKDRIKNPNILSSTQIQVLIKQNASTMFYTILKRLTPLANVDLLNESVYLNFYDEIIEEYVIYFRSWHFVTKFHIDTDSDYGKIFMENRRQVYKSLSDMLGSSIEHSKKFISLQYQLKLELVEKFQDYLEAGEKWMGKCEDIKLQKVMVDKLKKQLQNLLKLYNNLIKNIISQDLSVHCLDNPSSIQKVKLTNEQSHNNLNYEKIAKFVNKGVINDSKHQQDPPPQTSSKIGGIFTEMILQYIERSRYIESHKSVYIDSILQHYQFIMLMLFQVCVKETIKDRKNYNIKQKVGQLETIKLEEGHLKHINQLVRDELFRKKYFHLYQFLRKIGNKFDGIQIADIIDVNKVYDTATDDRVINYTRLVMRILADLLKIIKWILPFSETIGHHGKKQYLQHIPDLIKQLYSLILENFSEWLQKKYTNNLVPIILKLKWEIKKFNQETALMYKDYKMKFLQIFRNTTLTMVTNAEGLQQLKQILKDKQLEVFYRCLMEIYGKIEKINDNGRQLIKLDSVEICKILKDIGVEPQSWSIWFEKYLQNIGDRSSKNILEKVGNLGLLYPPMCWKANILWIISDFSSRQRKQYIQQLNKHYIMALKDSIV